MPSRVPARLGGRPSGRLEQSVARLPHLDAQWEAQRLAIAGAGGRDVALRARRRRDEQVGLREELNVVANLDGRWLRKVLVRVEGEARAHEDVEHVVHVTLDEAVAEGLARQVGVAAVCLVLAAE